MTNTMKLKLLSVRERPFDTDEGGKRQYYWYKAERLDTGVTIRVGCTDGELPLETVADYQVENTANGGFKITFD